MHEDGDDGSWGLPTSPTGRVPQWVIDEAARQASPPVPRPRRLIRRTARRALVVLVLVLTLGIGTAAFTGPGSWSGAPVLREAGGPDPGALDAGTGQAPSAGRLPDRPEPGIGAARKPRGVPPPPPPEGGAHAFVHLQTDGVTPVAYDPCRPVHYTIRPHGGPDEGEALVVEAVARISEVTGLQFVYDGFTDEVPGAGRELYQPERYGRRWAPVLIAWETEEENPALAGDVVGEAGSVPASLGDGPRVYLSGAVSLDAPRLGELLVGRDGRSVVRSIILHELGHLIGLAHVDDEEQLMFPEARRDVPDFSAGDLTGLATLGAGACVPEL
jgi:hypothetical protein